MAAGWGRMLLVMKKSLLLDSLNWKGLDPERSLCVRPSCVRCPTAGWRSGPRVGVFDGRAGADAEAMDSTVSEAEHDNEEVHKKYMHLEERLKEIVNLCGESGLAYDDIKEVVQTADQYLELIPTNKNGVRELLLDAGFFKQISSCVKSNIEASNTATRVFKPREFARKDLMNFKTTQARGDGPPQLTEAQWIKSGYAVMCLYKYTFGVEPLLGALETLDPPRPPRVFRRRERDPEVKKTVPDQLRKGESCSELKTEEVARVYSLLKQRYKENGKDPINFFSFVVNPYDYGLTIENLFHVSFLVRDKLVDIKENQDGFPVIIPLRANIGPSSSSPSTDTIEDNPYQCILHIDMQEWKDLIDLFDIKGAMIPPPQPHGKRPI